MWQNKYDFLKLNVKPVTIINNSHQNDIFCHKSGFGRNINQFKLNYSVINQSKLAMPYGPKHNDENL